MVTDGGFDASYMLFAGDALVPPDAGPFSQQRLYALYPAGMLAGDADDSLLFPAVQAYSPDAFDTEAVLMVAAPVEAEIPQEGTVHTAPFRFAHYTGYLRLSPKDMPAALSDERVSRIVLESLEGVPMAGGFTVSIDDAGGGWTLVPGADTESTVTLDCSGSTVTVGNSATAGSLCCRGTTAGWRSPSLPNRVRPYGWSGTDSQWHPGSSRCRISISGAAIP